MTNKPIGSAIRTFSGVLFDFAHPELSPISLVDIAHSLSLLCRFAGHTKKFYSVAEHAVRVSYACEPELAMWGLHHDDSECYCVDIPRPLKHLEGMENYREHERKVQKAIIAELNSILRMHDLAETEPTEVKWADMRLLVTEQRDLLHNSHPDFKSVPPLKNEIKPWSSRKANYIYQIRHAELSGWKLTWYDKVILWHLKCTLI